MTVCRSLKPAVTVWFLLAWLGILASGAAAQGVRIEGQISAQGKIAAIHPGKIILVDDQQQRREFKIAEQDKQTVSLGGSQVILRFPAEVSVTGEMQLKDLRRGVVIALEAQISKPGTPKGEVSKISVLGTKDPRLGIQVKQPADQASEPANCRVIGEVLNYRNHRLSVAVPRSEYAKRGRLSFKIAEDAQVQLESNDYQQAQPGDQVESLVAAKFSTGDLVIREIKIRLSRASAAGATRESADVARKYRHLSNEPSAPRDVRSAHFLLHTDISDRNAQMLLDQLETMIALVSQYYGRKPVGLIECFVVRDLSQWPEGSLDPAGVAKIAEPAGVTISRGLGRRVKSIVYSCDDFGVVQHESIHAYCAQTFGSSGPTWYAEGMAEMGQYWKKGERAVNIDPVVADYLTNAPPKKLLDIVAQGQVTGDSWKAYAWRWALCHLLANNPNYSRHFKGLGIALMTRQNTSFERVYGPVAREISFEYDQFVQHVSNGYRADLCAWQWNKKFLPLRGLKRVRAKVKSKYGWQATGAQLEAGTEYQFRATGTWKVDAQGEAIDADGTPDGLGRLVAVIMKDYQLSEPIELGKDGTFVAPSDGALYLRCNDAWNQIADNTGIISVQLQKAPTKSGR